MMVAVAGEAAPTSYRHLFSVAVLGAGAWGTALAIHFSRQGHRVVLYAHTPDHAVQLQQSRLNARYLPDRPFPPSLSVGGVLSETLIDVDVAIVATPCQAFPGVLHQIAPCVRFTGPIVWVCKGFEIGTGRLLHQVFADVFGSLQRAVVLSGPTFADEVARGMPTAVTLATSNAVMGTVLANQFHSELFRVYLSNDLVGVELGGAVKNVYAIAAGIADGLGFGDNARAALITRGLAELRRLGAAMGAQAETIFGLAGLGDLVLTCTSDQSRNRRLGLALGQGGTWREASAQIGHVVEGVFAAREVCRCARSLNVEMPIAHQVAAILHEGVSARDAVQQLLLRTPRSEF